MKSWEIYSAPSIVQRKFLKGLKIIDRIFFGSYFYNRLWRYNERVLHNIRFHRTGIWEEEEDEGLFFYNWYSLFIWFFFPLEVENAPYHRFDSYCSGAVKRSVMRLYRNCIKRHLYYHGGDKHYLTKNPSLSGKIDSLYRAFPDARIIFLVRNPLDVISSQMSWFSFAWYYFSDPLERYPFQETLIELSKHWYLYPYKRLQQEPETKRMIITFDQLVDNLEDVVSQIYQRFGFTMSNRFRALVKKEAERARKYRSMHDHTLDKAELSRERIYNEFGSVFDLFGFDRDI
jgi:hypothetical protein